MTQQHHSFNFARWRGTITIDLSEAILIGQPCCAFSRFIEFCLELLGYA